MAEKTHAKMDTGDGSGLDRWENGSGPPLPSVDTDYSDTDSVLGRLTALTSTASLRPSIYEHVEENGRTYHSYKQGKYPLPNDEQEQERLDFQHKLFGVTFDGRLHLAPIKPDCHNVLDFATGTGIWAIDFAQQYPSAKVTGTDLSAIQRLHIPTNCSFGIEDFEDEWNFSEKFDYIHGRALTACLKDPAFVIAQAFKSLAPGGYLELQDPVFPHQYIGPPPTESTFYKWNEAIVAGSTNIGRPWTHGTKYKKVMEDVGFEDVVEKIFYWPTSPWPKGAYLKTVGAYFQEDLSRALEAISLKVLTNGLGWSKEEMTKIVEEVKEEIKSTALHSYLPIYVVYGRKPLQAVNA